QPNLPSANTKHAIPTPHPRLRHDRPHFLRNHPDMRTTAAVIGEAIEAEAIVEAAEQDDVVLEPDVGPPSAATSSSETSATHTGAASPCSNTSATATTEARPPTLGLQVRYPAGLDIPKGAVTARRRPLCCAGLLATTRTSGAGGGSLCGFGLFATARGCLGLFATARGCLGLFATARALGAGGRPFPTLATIAGARTCGRSAISEICAVAGLEHLLATTAAKIHPPFTPRPGVVAESLLHARVVVSHSLAVLGIVIPMRDPVAAIDLDVVAAAAPIDPAAPIATRCPASQGVSRAECQSGREQPAGVIAG